MSTMEPSRSRNRSGRKSGRGMILFIAILSQGCVAGAYWLTLREYTENFGNSFQRLNSAEIEAGNILLLADRMNAIGTMLNWKCISGSRGDRKFLELGQAPCRPSLFSRAMVIRPEHQRELELRFILRLPAAIERAFLFFALLQGLLISLLIRSTRRFEQQKWAEQARWAAMAAQVAHDIRSPLAALDAVVSDLLYFPEEKRDLIRSAVGRIKDIANDLLSRNKASSIEGGTPVKAHNGTNAGIQLSSTIDRLISEKRLQYRSRLGLVIDSAHIDSSAYGIFSVLDPVELSRVLSNLINNSAEAISGGGRIEVALTGDSDWVFIAVKDNGSGIAPEVLPVLTRRGGTFGKSDGAGLGLFHARETIEHWGGSISVASTPGQGTVVTLKLPRSEMPQWLLPRLTFADGVVFVVLDDDASIHQLWRKRFDFQFGGLANSSVIHFTSPEDLLNWYVEQPQAFLNRTRYLVDFEFPGNAMNGLDVVEKLGIAANSTLVTSRDEDMELRKRCLQLGVKILPKTGIGSVPLTVISPRRSPDAVLLDDDELVRAAWISVARRASKVLEVYSDPSEMLSQASSLSLSTPIYVDSNLGEGVYGERIAEELFQRGFLNIYIATGYESDRFAAMSFLKGIIGKEPPADWCLRDL